MRTWHYHTGTSRTFKDAPEWAHIAFDYHDNVMCEHDVIIVDGPNPSIAWFKNRKQRILNPVLTDGSPLTISGLTAGGYGRIIALRYEVDPEENYEILRGDAGMFEDAPYWAIYCTYTHDTRNRRVRVWHESLCKGGRYLDDYMGRVYENSVDIPDKAVKGIRVRRTERIKANVSITLPNGSRCLSGMLYYHPTVTVKLNKQLSDETVRKLRETFWLLVTAWKNLSGKPEEAWYAAKRGIAYFIEEERKIEIR